MTSNPLPAEPATSFTLVATTTLPSGRVRVASAPVKVARLTGRSNVTRTLDMVVAVGPIGTLLTTCGAGGGAPRAAARLRMPPVATLSVRAEDFSAVPRIWTMTCLYVQVGFFDHTRAAAPV